MTDRINQGKGKGTGYKSSKGIICMIRCFKCGVKNYAPNVATGTCAFCGYNPNKITERGKG